MLSITLWKYASFAVVLLALRIKKCSSVAIRQFQYLYLVSNNSPFYSCVLGYQAFEQEWGQELPYINTNVAAFQM